MEQTIRELYERKSVRAFEDREISPEDQQTILTAAAMAPTAGNQQLYTILRVTDPAGKAALAELCDHQPFIAEGKLVLVFLADCRKWYRAFQNVGSEPRSPGPGDLILAVDDALIAAQNAVVAAHALDIGSCYIGDVMENCEAMRQLLRLPEYVFPAALLVFGYPTPRQKTREKPRRADLEHIVRENVYRDHTPEELFSMVTRDQPGCDEEWIRAFCRRKYNSDFAREMNRSVALYLKDFETDE